MQYISHMPALRDDVRILKNSAVDDLLTKRAAKKSGICTVRENIHTQLLDEIIRQITLDCVERGLLLHRVKENEKMLLASYQTLYHSALTFGTRKKLQAEYGKEDLRNKIDMLERKKATLKNRETILKNKNGEIERRISERDEIDNTRRTQEIEFLNKQLQRTTKFRDMAKKQKNDS